MPTYLAYGLVVRADLDVPGGHDLEQGSGAEIPTHQIEIKTGRCALRGPAVEDGPFQLAGNTLLFRMQGIAAYLCEGGERIIVERYPGADESDVTAYLVATALPALLWMRGDIVLHAAAAMLRGASSAIAIGGASGSGKSTVLDRLAADGSGVVADDTIRLQIGSDGARIMSGLPAAYFLSHERGTPKALRPRHDVPKVQQVGSAPVGALVVLRAPSAVNPPAFRRLTPAAALETLLQSRHRARVPRILKRDRDLFDTFLDMARDLPVYEWIRAEGVSDLGRREIDALASVVGV